MEEDVIRPLYANMYSYESDNKWVFTISMENYFYKIQTRGIVPPFILRNKTMPPSFRVGSDFVVRISEKCLEIQPLGERNTMHHFDPDRPLHRLDIIKLERIDSGRDWPLERS
jgi:hypothetical protein